MNRVVHIFGSLAMGGAETMIMNYYRHIDRDRLQFDFITHCSTEDIYQREIVSLGGRVYRLPRFKGYNIFGYRRAWRALLREHPEWGTAHIHLYSIAGIFLPIIKREGIARRILHSHNTSSPAFNIVTRLFVRYMRRKANRYTTDRFACSVDAGEYFFGKRDFIVVNNAIDVKRFTFNSELRRAKRQELNLDDSFTIGHVGRFNEQKNHTFIIDIFKEAHKLNSSVKLILVGVGSPIFEQVEMTVSDAELEDCVQMAGAREDVNELMQAFDIFILPSLHEGLGIVAIEAQAAGLHTFVSDNVPDAALITELAHKLSLSDTAQAWAEQILKYNNNYIRRNMFDAVRRAGYEVGDCVVWLENFYLNGE